MPLSSGQTLNNRYRIVKLLGQGGFGAVYRAWDLNIKAPCAVKENLDTSPEAQRQFEHEAIILANLHHPNLPRVTDHFIIPGQGQYLVMDFVDGDNLQELLERSGGPLPEDMALSWLTQICDALTYLHSQKPAIIHRDIKPANIKITSDGRAMLVDFGIAKIFDPHLKTTIGARAITPGYSPPEQYGQGSTDRRSDIYALGATLYTALTGQQPTESVQRTIGTPLTAPRQINRSISPRAEAIILKAMDTAPTGRFQSALELKNFLAGQAAFPLGTQMQAQPLAVTVSPATAAAVQPRSKLPVWAWAGGAGVLLIGLVLVAVVVYLLLKPAGTSRASQTALARAETHTAEARAEARSATHTVEALVVAPTATNAPTAQVMDTATPVATSPPSPPTATEVPGSSPTQPIATLPPTPTLVQPGLQPMIYDAFNIPMALVPAGPFTMGGNPDVGNQECLTLYINHASDCTTTWFEDAPSHPVTLSDYYIDLYEVTNARYAQCVSAGICSLPERQISQSRTDYYENPSFDDYPVLYVDWQAAQTYCQWRGGSLPTEAQWEKAARGTDGRLYPWGNNFDGNSLNFCDSSCTTILTADWANLSYNDGYGDTSPVGSYSSGASPYGIYDLGGNVWEWIADWYERNYYSLSPSLDPTGPPSGEWRVVRGGSWSYSGFSALTFYRDTEDPGGGHNNVGFRCVLIP
jgi:formylglycine-generating enzyme required for sulfatase activity